MGLFDRIKSPRDIVKEEIKKTPWSQLTTTEELDAAIKASYDAPVAIFKHSTTCGISRMALKGFESGYDIPEDKIQLYFLDLKRFHDLSGAISERLGVRHESPQLLLLKNGEVVYHESHGGIDREVLVSKI